ncbi:acylphosphatase [Endozoicomonas sp. GU-1]|uniref:acylphosphatase n=1 Tax=Endozoicomonas sp. GU-1 TaxID=3009078 RepID=UPI0022B4FE56|nr:acylphosphatase [Endozoicomonas sp. GU-1]WBA80172.1 acylphosphatase [Endozoicomonas sp. GU-1]WBA87748.1 acylphosphatase [Endozoicomonas sp. GU-1]
MADVCKRAFVEGRVQGVWFRGSTQERARRLGIGGWARNLPDGRVEVLMCGSEEAVARLEEWLHKGPPLARVVNIAITEESLQAFDSFTTG